MAGHTDKMRQLDDEMSRFEAEISGPSPHPSEFMARNRGPIIGANTFAQVKQRLVRENDDMPVLQPPTPPRFGGPMMERPDHENPGKNMRRPYMPPNAFPPPQMPTQFSNGNRGPPNFRPQGPPHPPPGFIPPQLRGMNNSGPMMGGNNHSNMGPRGMPYLRPPPPPPGLLAGHRNDFQPENPAVIMKPPTKPSTVISSAPKLYTAQPQSTDVQKEDLKTVNIPKLEPFQPSAKKRKVKGDDKKMNSKPLDKSHALQMAERVKQSMSTVTTKQTGNHPPSEEKRRDKKNKKNLRYAGGQVWEDANLAEWDPDDFRMFAGDLGNDVTDDLLHRHFCHYTSFVKAKVVRDKRTNKSKGYGFISFKDSQDYIRAMKEMNGKYLGSRPIKLRKSMWKDRNLDTVQRKLKEKQLLGLK